MNDGPDPPPESSSFRIRAWGIALTIAGVLVVVFSYRWIDHSVAAFASMLVFLGCLLISYDHFRSRR